jgi:hypothetical protein
VNINQCKKDMILTLYSGHRYSKLQKILFTKEEGKLRFLCIQQAIKLCKRKKMVRNYDIAKLL